MLVCLLCKDIMEGASVEISGTDGDNGEITKLINKNLSIELSIDTCVSSMKICNNCFSHINAFRLFCEFIENKQRDFLKHLSDEILKIEDAELNQAEVKIRRVEEQLLLGNNVENLLDIKDVLVTGADENTINSNDSHDFICVDAETHECFQSDSRSNKDNHSEDDDIPLQSLITSIKLKHPREKRNVNMKANRKPRLKKNKPAHAKKKVLKSKTLEKLNDVLKRKCKRNEDVVNAIVAQKGRNETIIAQHMRLKCDLCDETAVKFLDLKRHFRKVHNIRGYMNCCDRKYYKSASLADHIQLHIDPSAFKCKECGKNLRSKSCLEIHIRNKHVKKDELRFGCSECGRRFAHTTNLKAHALTHAVERQFVCEYCQKGFKTNYSLSVHVLALHKDIKSFICDICGEEFKMKASFDRHIAEHAGKKKSIPSVQCHLCDKWVLKYNLKKHMDTHDRVEVKCPQCGKILASKSSLASHIIYVHSKKPNLKCTFCDKTFKQRNNLQEHMGIHTGAKDHACPHCHREFRSKANMYVHIKRNHVNEWMEAQLSRIKSPFDQQNDCKEF